MQPNKWAWAHALILSALGGVQMNADSLPANARPWVTVGLAVANATLPSPIKRKKLR